MTALAHPPRPRIRAEEVIFRLQRGDVEIRATVQHTEAGRRLAIQALFRGTTGPVVWLGLDAARELARAIDRATERRSR